MNSMDECMSYSINCGISRMDYLADIQDAEERGEKRGEKRGLKIGEKRGAERVAKLVRILTAENRKDDISRIIADREYLHELFRAFNL